MVRRIVQISSDQASKEDVHPPDRFSTCNRAIVLDRSSISPRKQLWIKAVKKLTSERLGREGLAAWEDRKSNNDPEVAEEEDINEPAEDAEAAKAEPEAAAAAATEQPVADEEAQTQRGTRETISYARDT